MARQVIVLVDDVLSCVVTALGHLHPWPRIEPALGYTPAMRFAIRLLQVQVRETDGRKTWKLRRQWKAGLLLAGIDPRFPSGATLGTKPHELITIVDQEKFNLAWRQLTQNRCTYSVKKQRLMIAQGLRAPLASDHVYWVYNDPPSKRKPKQTEESPIVTQMKNFLQNRQ